VAAIGSLSSACDGLQPVRNTALAGEVVIFPHTKEMPLTALPDPKDELPRVWAMLKDGREWSGVYPLGSRDPPAAGSQLATRHAIPAVKSPGSVNRPRSRRAALRRAISSDPAKLR
jgi:hypothetical protein